MPAFDLDNLRLTDFMDLPTLQEIQDSFAAVANVKAIITDAEGNLLTQPAPSGEFLKRQQTLAAADEMLSGGGAADSGPQKEGREYVAPIIVGGKRLGTIRMSANGTVGGLDEVRINTIGERFGLDAKRMRSLVTQLVRSRATRPAAIQFLFLLANAAFGRDDMKAAKDRLRHVIAIDPAHARSHYVMGLVLIREGANREARTHMQRFLELAPGDPDAASAKEALAVLK